MAKVKIYISLKEGILDPQGVTIGNALENLGFENVDNVRIGKYITLDIDNENPEKQIDDMCKKLLANPIIEEFNFEVE